MLMVRGDRLPPALQRKALGAFPHRYTIEHKPRWARERDARGAPYSPQHLSDADWLANTLFPVTAKGEFDRRAGFCRSFPTWPSRPDLAAKAAQCPEGDPYPGLNVAVTAA